MAEKKDMKRTFSVVQKNHIYDRQKGKCWDCGKPLPATIAEYHHLKAHSSSGRTTTGNGVALCPNCHTAIHKRERLKKANTKRPKATAKTKPKVKSTKKRARRSSGKDIFGVGEIKVPRFKSPSFKVPKW